jgi:multidrug efflux pump subunit AcrA (membrane-fusion protein)
MLDDDTKSKIRAEEEAKAASRAALEAEAEKGRLEREYRQRIATELKGRRSRRNRVLAWVGGLTVIGAVAAGALLLRSQNSNPLPDDGFGGIRTSDLIERCKADVRGKLGDGQAEFPTDTEAQSQISASSDGKRWDGWAICPNLPGRPRAEFSCQYTPLSDTTAVEIIKP